ncbi:MAG: nuclear transport factor 2 family protein [Pseudomonadota bacterium]
MTHEAMNKTLTLWSEMIAAKDLAALPGIIREDAVFRSPVAHSPYHGRDALVLALSTVIEVFENFTYHRKFFTEDGRNATLEFSADVNGKKLKGVDLIAFDEDGMISAFEVMIRPATGLMALGEEMGKRVGGKLTEFK